MTGWQSGMNLMKLCCLLEQSKACMSKHELSWQQGCSLHDRSDAWSGGARVPESRIPCSFMQAKTRDKVQGFEPGTGN